MKKPSSHNWRIRGRREDTQYILKLILKNKLESMLNVVTYF